MFKSSSALFAATATLAPSLAAAFSFTFGSTPTQCQNATINIVGDDGVEPYNILILAYGHPPGGNEVRKIISHDWTGKSTSVEIAFPSNSQFVAVVSDSKNVGSGGTSVSVNVAASDDTACLPTSVTPAFYLFLGDGSSLEPPIDQCTDIRLAWSANASAPVSLIGVVPGGNSFNIDTSQGTKSSDGTQIGFNWTPDVPQFTDILLVAGDASGRGSGGSTGIINIGGGPKDCLTGTYPTSTPGTPAGGVYATNASGGSTGSSGGGGSNTGAIIGGVIGALVFVIIVLSGLLFYFWRRRRLAKRNHIKEKPDLADDPAAANHMITDNGDPHHQLPAGYEPEPFIVPPSVTSASRPQTPSSLTGTHAGVPPTAWTRRLSNNSSSAPRQSTDGGDSSSYAAFSDRKQFNGPAPLRPVNIIQHDDGGAVSPQGQDEPETVELPPAYGNIRPNAGASSSTPAPPPPA
ncbi:hypothetical protein EXIGLDRAFT_734385 [Exidia glandulosa HHB12029]|uniref:Mid2 domain-containing protein n=1 Tax=Exidia glandulosa HHB12029 TaxID=1314781 RepID=A0A165K766_EXIGL|nr:hypothetical protein EXIGLDRAFT_734385 [Exidia glandulosa HHB12029]